MKIGVPKEIFEGEARVAMTPDSALQLQKLGYDCAIETGAGALAGFSDATYEAAGVEIIKTPAALFKAVDIVAKVRPPSETETKRLKARICIEDNISPNIVIKALCDSAVTGINN